MDANRVSVHLPSKVEVRQSKESRRSKVKVSKARSRTRTAASGEGSSRLTGWAGCVRPAWWLGRVRYPRRRRRQAPSRGRRRSLVCGLFAYAAADPEKVLGLRPPTGRTDPSPCAGVNGWLLGLLGDGERFRFVRKAPLQAFNASKGALRTCGGPDLVTGSDISAFSHLGSGQAHDLVTAVAPVACCGGKVVDHGRIPHFNQKKCGIAP